MHVHKPARLRSGGRITGVLVVFALALSSLLFGAASASADDPYATPGPSVPGAVNTNKLFVAADGSRVNAVKLWDAPACKPFQPKTGHPYGSATLRVVDATFTSNGYGATRAKATLSGLEQGKYELVIVTLKREGSTITGCSKTSAGSRFAVTSYAVPQAIPFVEQQFPVGTSLQQLVVVEAGKPVTEAKISSEPFWTRRFAPVEGGHRVSS